MYSPTNLCTAETTRYCRVPTNLLATELSIYKMTIDLTFEIFDGASSELAPYKFSKVRSAVILYGEFSSEGGN